MRDTKYHFVVVIASISKNLQVSGEGRGGTKGEWRGREGREHTQNIAST